MSLQRLNRYCIRRSRSTVGLRVMFWNMHGFVETRSVFEYNRKLWAVLQRVQPDLLAMAEHTPFGPHAMLCQMFPYFHVQSGLALYSKAPFRHVTTQQLTPARYLSDYMVTGDGVHVYLTHLSPTDAQERMQGITEILRYKEDRGHTDVILVGDFNQPDVREMSDRDQYLESYRSRTGDDYINIFEQLDEQFCDSFLSMGAVCPQSTHWTGTRIDFIFLSMGLTATHACVYHTTLSDHLPVITDVAMCKPRS